MRNAFGSHPQWRENPYLHLLAGESGQCHKDYIYKELKNVHEIDFTKEKINTIVHEDSHGEREINLVQHVWKKYVRK